MDTLGLVLCVLVHSAGIQDKTAAKTLIKSNPKPSNRLKLMWADMGYESGPLKKLLKVHWQTEMEIKKHPWQGRKWSWVPVDKEPPKMPPKPKGFVVLPQRWVVERTFAWLGLDRRHSKDYETLPEQSEFFILLSMTKLMLRRLAKF